MKSQINKIVKWIKISENLIDVGMYMSAREETARAESALAEIEKEIQQIRERIRVNDDYLREVGY